MWPHSLQVRQETAVVLVMSHQSMVKVNEVAQLCQTVCNPTDCSPPGFSGHGLSRQEYWSGLSFHSPGDPPDPGIKPGSPALQANSLAFEPLGNPVNSEGGLNHLCHQNSHMAQRAYLADEPG